MIWFSWPETLLMLMGAIVLDFLVGDPRPIPHPVILIGKWIGFWESKLLPGPAKRANGVLLMLIVTASSFALTWAAVAAAWRIHPWLGYATNTWLISTTVAIKGLKDAAMLVYRALSRGDLTEARKYTGYIVGRDTDGLDASELSRAAVETVAENTVDAVVSPLFFALLGGAPLAMFYRAANTLDSMVGYRNEKYLRFGWASARLDDALNWIPARLTGWMLVAVSLFYPPASASRSRRAVRDFARLHPSPNSGIPESAVAGGLGIQLGGVNRYGGIPSERARLGWANRPIEREDIRHAVRLLYGVSYLIMGGLSCAALALCW
ncbi:cobalamin biosynthesis protein CobD [Cohnella sp. CFH 77786]|uniref:adenosylcobinamide-phosphate synthase CbiB n=1 Tax=Cohnella sp. CFH 77786 TaxID=2662265 RepID=UPI001C60BD8C|nr:adenosylcobinamide-phosphate synthase CbiB [Cohnella sp. CFH 77786]MBW5448016.1 cobalamin biosynthesis protein CobD [Cohnella sp. CFH 77786]